MASSTLSLPLSKNPIFLPLALLATVLSVALTFTFGLWTFIALLVCWLVLKLVPDLRTSFLVFLCVLPSFGELGEHTIQPNVWIPFYAVLVSSWLYHVATRPQQIHFNGPLTVGYLAFLLTCILSLIGSYDLGPESIGKDFLNSPYRGVWEALLLSGLGIFSMSAFETERQLEKIFWVIILSSLLVYVPSFFITGQEIEPDGQISRRAGLFTDAHMGASYMLFATILAISLLKNASGRVRALLLLAIGVFLSTHYLTVVKTVLVTMLIVFLFSIFVDKGLKKMVSYGVLLLLGAAAVYPLLPAFLQGAFQQIVVSLFVDYTQPVARHGGFSTFAPRVEHWLIGFDLLTKDLSLIGVGIGKHTSALRPFVLLHVYYVQILAETGILGLLIFLSVIFITLFIAFRSLFYYRRMKNHKMEALVKGMILSFLATLIIFTSVPGGIQEHRLFWVLVGLIGATDGLIKKNQREIETLPALSPTRKS